MQKRLSQECQKSIGQQAISGSNISHIAEHHRVCRNTVYAQKRRAQSALDDAFMISEPEDTVLFHLPVTKSFLHQIVLGILLICKGSYRDVQLFLQDLFDTDMSIGTIFNIHDEACRKAAVNNALYSLSSIKHSASDEIYHRNKPHLAVVDVRSRYCASLTREDCRDADTWTIHLLDLMEQGFQPMVNISDHGAGMIRAFKDVLPETERRLDHFHLIKSCKELIRYLKNQKESAVTRQIKLLEKMERAKLKSKGNTFSAKLAHANKEMSQAEYLYRHVTTLGCWLQYDILQLAGCNPMDRELLFDFILAELSTVAALSPRIKAFVGSLIHQKVGLLAASHVLSREFQQVASRYSISEQDVWDVCYVARYDIQTLSYHNKADALASRLGKQYEQIEDEVLNVLAATPRCSSMIENFNSRLRPYLDARKQITSESLDLIRFYLNHQVFLRSRHDYMQGKTPAEVLSGSRHPNWLEMLSFTRFKRLALAA